MNFMNELGVPGTRRRRLFRYLLMLLMLMFF